MRFFPEIRQRIRILFFGLPAAPATAQDGGGRYDPLPVAKPGRPISGALARTLEELAANPAITPAEISSLLSVSQSYARTLLRRARARRHDAPVPLRPHIVQEIPHPDSSAEDIQTALDELSARIVQTESHVAALRTPPAPVRGSLNLSRRAEVLRLSAAGQTSAAIAGDLGVPGGEVEFILKIDRLLAASAHAG
jgi:DNA-binding CsgD family transcriptional regulator